MVGHEENKFLMGKITLICNEKWNKKLKILITYLHLQQSTSACNQLEITAQVHRSSLPDALEHNKKCEKTSIIQVNLAKMHKCIYNQPFQPFEVNYFKALHEKEAKLTRIIFIHFVILSFCHR